MSISASRFFRSNRDLVIVVGLGLLVIAVYFQTTGFGFINLDDNLYVYDNPALRDGLSIKSIGWAFTTYWSANWHPLTWLSHALDIELFGLDPGKHHAVNVLIHLVNSILAFIVFRKMTGREWESLAVAALFAVHPAHVESVAWISERKDVLSTMFWLLTMYAYVRYLNSVESDVEPSEAVEVNRAARMASSMISPRYLLVAGLFAAGLLAKPMLVTLPFVLLLCDLWPLKRLGSVRDLLWRALEKLPLFGLSAASSLVTYLAQRSAGAVESFDYLPMPTRLLNALISYARYILTLFYPADLAVFYPYDRAVPSWQISVSVILLAAITAVSIWQYRTRPFLIVGWLWFLGTLVPVIGIIQVGSQSLADRYTYVPYFGLFIMLVWGASSLVNESGFGRKAISAGCVVAVLVLAGLAIRQTSHWRDNETLYRHTLAVTTNNYLIAHNLCHHFVLQDRLDEGEPLCRQAIEQRPTYSEPYNTLGILEFKRGKFAEAEQDFKDALKYAPQYHFALVNLAQAQSRQGKASEAEETLRRAVASSGDSTSQLFVPALSDIAAAYAAQRNFERSADNLKRLIFLDPDNADARARLALTLVHLGRSDEAQTEAQNAIKLMEDSADAWNALGQAALANKDNKLAVTSFERLLKIDPAYPDAQKNLESARSGSEAQETEK